MLNHKDYRKKIYISFAVCLGIITLILFLSSKNFKKVKIIFDLKANNISNEHADLVIDEISYQGATKSGDKYEIYAQKAKQESTKKVSLEKVKCILNTKDSKEYIIKSETADFNIDETLKLYELSATHENVKISVKYAEFDVKKYIVTGRDDIKIKYNNDNITADNFMIDYNEQTIDLNGNVHVVLF